MSQALKPETGQRPRPQSVRIAPPFSGSGLPKSPADLAENMRMQQRDERRARSQAALDAARNAEAAPAELCQTALHLSLFFDGTNNNELADKRFEPRCTSNVAHLYHATFDHQSMAKAANPVSLPDLEQHAAIMPRWLNEHSIRGTAG